MYAMWSSQQRIDSAFSNAVGSAALRNGRAIWDTASAATGIFEHAEEYVLIRTPVTSFPSIAGSPG